MEVFLRVWSKIQYSLKDTKTHFFYSLLLTINDEALIEHQILNSFGSFKCEIPVIFYLSLPFSLTLRGEGCQTRCARTSPSFKTFDSKYNVSLRGCLHVFPALSIKSDHTPKVKVKLTSGVFEQRSMKRLTPLVLYVCT